KRGASKGARRRAGNPARSSRRRERASEPKGAGAALDRGAGCATREARRLKRRSEASGKPCAIEPEARARERAEGRRRRPGPRSGVCDGGSGAPKKAFGGERETLGDRAGGESARASRRAPALPWTEEWGVRRGKCGVSKGARRRAGNPARSSRRR